MFQRTHIRGRWPFLINVTVLATEENGGDGQSGRVERLERDSTLGSQALAKHDQTASYRAALPGWRSCWRASFNVRDSKVEAAAGVED
jgi:hypothetical protein